MGLAEGSMMIKIQCRHMSPYQMLCTSKSQRWPEAPQRDLSWRLISLLSQEGRRHRMDHVGRAEFLCWIVGWACTPGGRLTFTPLPCPPAFFLPCWGGRRKNSWALGPGTPEKLMTPVPERPASGPNSWARWLGREPCYCLRGKTTRQFCSLKACMAVSVSAPGPSASLLSNTSAW